MIPSSAARLEPAPPSPRLIVPRRRYPGAIARTAAHAADGGRRVLLTLYFPTAFISLGQGLVIPTIPSLAAAFGIAPALAAQVITAQSLGRAVITIPSGVLI